MCVYDVLTFFDFTSSANPPLRADAAWPGGRAHRKLHSSCSPESISDLAPCLSSNFGEDGAGGEGQSGVQNAVKHGSDSASSICWTGCAAKRASPSRECRRRLPANGICEDPANLTSSWLQASINTKIYAKAGNWAPGIDSPKYLEDLPGYAGPLWTLSIKQLSYDLRTSSFDGWQLSH